MGMAERKPRPDRGVDDPLRAQGSAQAQQGEVAALRARLREVEVALGLPAGPGQAAPPALPALLRRVAALVRQVGLVPGLVPLPGQRPAVPSTPSDGPGRRRGWWRAARLSSL